MPLPSNEQFSPTMDVFTARLKDKVDFLKVVDATKQAFEESDMSYRLHMKRLGEGRFLAMFMHKIGGPLKSAISISATSQGSVSDAVVHEIKGDNWIKFTNITERVLSQFGGVFTVQGFHDAEVKTKKTVEKTDFSYIDSAFIKAARDISQFAELEQVPDLVRLISSDENRSALAKAMDTHGWQLTREMDASPSVGPSF